MTRIEYYDQQSQTSVVRIDAIDSCDIEIWWKNYPLVQLTYWQNEYCAIYGSRLDFAMLAQVQPDHIFLMGEKWTMCRYCVFDLDGFH